MVSAEPPIIAIAMPGTTMKQARMNKHTTRISALE
jgi:hypothetical protein